MPYFSVCENCGAHLDPGEECDCMKTPAKGTNQGGQAEQYVSSTYRNMHLYYTKNAPKCQGGNENKD